MTGAQEDKLRHILIRKGIGGLTLVDYLGLKNFTKIREILLELSHNGDIFLPINVVENIWATTTDKGWGNGYVDIPARHPCYGKPVKDIINTFDGKMIQRISYSDLSESGWWRIGFDTLNRPKIKKEKVIELTLNLLIELYAIK
jgi:hypothetical protein